MPFLHRSLTLYSNMPGSLKDGLKRLSEKAASGEHLVFHTRNGTPFSDTNLLHQHLKPVGRKLGMPWLNWHTLRRTHATLRSTRERRSKKRRRSWSLEDVHYPRTLHHL